MQTAICSGKPHKYDPAYLRTEDPSSLMNSVTHDSAFQKARPIAHAQLLNVVRSKCKYYEVVQGLLHVEVYRRVFMLIDVIICGCRLYRLGRLYQDACANCKQ